MRHQSSIYLDNQVEKAAQVRRVALEALGGRAALRLEAFLIAKVALALVAAAALVGMVV